jgi:hypothetical protein
VISVRSARPVRPSALLLFVVACVLACATFLAPPARASVRAQAAPSPSQPATSQPATAMTWSVRPTPIEGTPSRPNFSFDVEGGQTIDDSIRVRNFGAAPLTLAVYASDALTSTSGALDLLPAGKQPKDVGAWLELDTDTVSLEPGAFVDVPFSMYVPVNAAAGDHTGGIVTSVTTETTGKDDAPVLLDRRLGTRVQVRVGGPLRPRLEVTDLQATYDGTLNPVGKGTMHVKYTVKNTGNVRVTANPTIEVKGPLGVTGTTLHSAAMPELLPANSLTFTADLDVFPAVHLDTTVELEPRTTEDRTELPAKVTTASASAGVWAIPWALLVVVAVVVVAIVLWIWSRRRRQRDVDAKVQAAVAAALGTKEADATPSA